MYLGYFSIILVFGFFLLTRPKVTLQSQFLPWLSTFDLSLPQINVKLCTIFACFVQFFFKKESENHLQKETPVSPNQLTLVCYFPKCISHVLKYILVKRDLISKRKKWYSVLYKVTFILILSLKYVLKYVCTFVFFCPLSQNTSFKFQVNISVAKVFAFM